MIKEITTHFLPTFMPEEPPFMTFRSLYGAYGRGM